MSIPSYSIPRELDLDQLAPIERQLLELWDFFLYLFEPTLTDWMLLFKKVYIHDWESRGSEFRRLREMSLGRLKFMGFEFRKTRF